MPAFIFRVNCVREKGAIMNKLLGRLAVDNGLEFYLFCGLGLLCILAAIFNWDFWFESRKVRFISKLITRTGARIFTHY